MIVSICWSSPMITFLFFIRLLTIMGTLKFPLYFRISLSSIMYKMYMHDGILAGIYRSVCNQITFL